MKPGIAGIAVVLALVLPLGVLPAAAQYPGGGGGGAPRGGGMGGMLPPRQDPARINNPDTALGLTGQVQEQLGRLGDDLRITAAQRGTWNAYSDRVMKLADDIARGRFITRAPDAGEAGAPQQFDRLADIARNRMTAVEDIVDAGKALYSTLSPEQKSIADRRLAAIALQLAASGTAPPDAAAAEAARKR